MEADDERLGRAIPRGHSRSGYSSSPRESPSQSLTVFW